MLFFILVLHLIVKYIIKIYDDDVVLVLKFTCEVVVITVVVYRTPCVMCGVVHPNTCEHTHRKNAHPNTNKDTSLKETTTHDHMNTTITQRKTFSQDTDTHTDTQRHTTKQHTNGQMCVFDLSVRSRIIECCLWVSKPRSLQTEVSVFETGDLQKFRNVRFRCERSARVSEMWVSDTNDLRGFQEKKTKFTQKKPFCFDTTRTHRHDVFFLR